MKENLTDENKPAWYRGLFWVLLVAAAYAVVLVAVWPWVEMFFMLVLHELRYQLWLLSLLTQRAAATMLLFTVKFEKNGEKCGCLPNYL